VSNHKQKEVAVGDLFDSNDDDFRIVDEAIVWFDDDDANTHALGGMLLANGGLLNVEVLA